MNVGFLALLSQRIALQKKLEVESENLSNILSQGFKHESIRLHTVSSPKSDASFVTTGDPYYSNAPGSYELTGEPLDVSITSNGYFALEHDGKIFFTKKSSYMLDNNRTITDKLGNRLLDTNKQPINIPHAKDILIKENGEIFADNISIATIGSFVINNFKKIDGTSFAAVGDDNLEESPKVKQGMKEGSNVNSIASMTSLTEITNAYTYADKAMENLYEVQKKHIDVVKV